MTQSFDEWMDTTKYRGYVDENEMESAYEAGQQSRQAGIDGLTIKLNGANERAMSLLNHKNRMVDKMQAEIDELQKRIDKAIQKWISITSIATTQCNGLPDEFYQKLDELHDALTLKGTQDEK